MFIRFDMIHERDRQTDGHRMMAIVQRRHKRGAYNTLMTELRHMDLEGDATYHQHPDYYYQIESRRI